MIDRNHIERILRINGITPSQPDDIIRSVLLSARYNNEEVDTALMVLRENVATKKIRVEGLHKVFRTDESLQPDEISELLGIDVDISRYSPEVVESRQSNLSTFIIIWIASVVIAVVGVLLFMHMNSIGPFHPGALY